MHKSPDAQLWAAFTASVTPLPHRPLEPPPKPARAVAAPRGDRYLDLHGLRLQEAWEAVRDHVLDAALDGRKKTLVVTGFSGAIRKEFPRWIESLARVRSAEATHGNGAFVLRLRTR